MDAAYRAKLAVSGNAALEQRRSNAELRDTESVHYPDFTAGIAVLNTGHHHRKVIAAAKAQMEQFTHSAFQVAPYESYIELAEKLNAIVPCCRSI